MRDEFENGLDALLDAALCAYAGAEHEDEAVGDVTSRTMAAVRASSSSSLKRRAAWGLWALPVAAMLVLAAVLVPLRHTRAAYEARVVPRSTTRAVQAPEQVRVPVPSAPSATSPVTIGRVSAHVQRRVAAVPEPLPKLDVFPAPTPLTPQERALVAMVQRDPKQAEQATAKIEPKPIAPLEVAPLNIAAIEIKPLNPSEADDKR